MLRRTATWLSQRPDRSVLNFLDKEQAKQSALLWHWLPSEGGAPARAARPRALPDVEREGFINLTDGNVAITTAIRKQNKYEIGESFKIREIALRSLECAATRNQRGGEGIEGDG